MSIESDGPIEALGTLSAQVLGVVAILTQELVQAKAVDVDSLRGRLEEFWNVELGSEENSMPSEQRMIQAVQRVIRGALEIGVGHEKRD